MSDEYVMIRSDTLLGYTKDIFGDLVAKAWVACCGGSREYAIEYALKDFKI